MHYARIQQLQESAVVESGSKSLFSERNRASRCQVKHIRRKRRKTPENVQILLHKL